MTTLDQFAAAGTESGVGLALEDGQGRFVFFLAGSRHRCEPGERFFAGVGGHREPGESWVECAHREALEEIGAPVELVSADTTWQVEASGEIHPVDLTDAPRPLALYQILRPGTDYRIAVYRARLLGVPKDLPADEVGGLVALLPAQLAALEGKPTLASLLARGAAFTGELDPQTRLYPIGTAAVLARLLRAGCLP